jgi:hypothetical protein
MRKRKRKSIPHRVRYPELDIEQILAWADVHGARTGRWPTARSGPVYGAPREKWAKLQAALREGHRGLPGGSSLARLLVERRGVRNRMALPRFNEEQILAWADAHHARTGAWPSATSRPIADAPGETWLAVQTALVEGCRGLPGGSSLAQLLSARRGVRNHQALPPLPVEQILVWADAHHARHGAWPNAASGPVDGRPGDTWFRVDAALRLGQRGLPGGSSLARLLLEQRGVAHHLCRPRLSEEQILAWADAYHESRPPQAAGRLDSLSVEPGAQPG